MFGFRKKKSEDPAEAVSAGVAPFEAPVCQLPSPEEEMVLPSVGATDLSSGPDAAAPMAPGDGLEIVVPPRKDTAVILAEFEHEIDRQEDRLYGVALFFECVSLLHAGQTGVLDTNRKQFRNIIVAGHASVAQARALAGKAKQDESAIDAVRAFRFTFCEGHPNPLGLAARADALLKAYERLFPDRPPDKPFTEEETYRLLETASGIISAVLHEP